MQIAVARLASDPALRARFAGDPAGTAASLGLDSNDAAAISRLNTTGLDRFAATLDRKELKRLRHEMPHLCRVLGNQLPRIFSEFRNAHGGSDRRSVEALTAAFAAFVGDRSENDSLTRDVATLERRCVRLLRSWWPLAICPVHHRLGDSREPSTATQVTARPLPGLRLAIVFRWNGRVRIKYMPLRPAMRRRVKLDLR